MRVQMTPRTVRRILAADGFLDLGMPERAVEELARVEDAGPLTGPLELMYGIALKHLGDHPEAIRHLEKAARVMPSPIRRFAWRELVECYRAVGSEELATMADKLGGDGEIQLRIALPFAQMMLNIPVSDKSES